MVESKDKPNPEPEQQEIQAPNAHPCATPNCTKPATM